MAGSVGWAGIEVPRRSLAAAPFSNPGVAASAGRRPVVRVGAAGVAGPGQYDFVATGVNDEAVIQRAIAALPAEGGSVFLSAGTFVQADEVLIGRSNVTLAGQGAATLLVTRQPVHNISIRGAGATQRISDVVVCDLRVKGSGDADQRGVKPTGIWTGPTGVEIMFANRVTVQGVHAEDHPYDGIGVPQAAAHIAIENNIVSGSLDDGINPGGSPRVDPLVEYVRVVGNSVYRVAETGIHISGRVRHAVVVNNMVWDVPDESGAAGIDFPDTHNLVIAGNIIDMTGNTRARGIWGRSWSGGDHAQHIVIANNVVHGGRYGITVEHGRFEDVLICDNVIAKTHEDGVFLTHGRAVVVEGNRFTGVGRRAIHGQGGASRAVVRGNVIRDLQANNDDWTNAGISLTAGDGHHVSGNDIRGNPTGSAIVIHGQGNTVTHNVIHDQQLHGIVLASDCTETFVTGNHIQAARQVAIQDNGERNSVEHNATPLLPVRLPDG